MHKTKTETDSSIQRTSWWLPDRRQVGGVGEIVERDQVAKTCSLIGVTLPQTNEYLRLLKAGRARKNVPLETLERA